MILRNESNLNLNFILEILSKYIPLKNLIFELCDKGGPQKHCKCDVFKTFQDQVKSS